MQRIRVSVMSPHHTNDIDNFEATIVRISQNSHIHIVLNDDKLITAMS